ncbi:VPA1262 family protein [Aeromonas rivipollensis]|uniref:VPA1262 family protein n=1 Tax=Aeromonas rivipollensis TaxID=948519 RepID=UPI0038D244C5
MIYISERLFSNGWSFSNNDNYRVLGNIKVKITRLNLYIDSIHCAELLRQLTAGQSISAINEALGLECPKNLRKQFGSTTLVTDNLVYRPVAYLLNRDAHERRSLSSPHNEAGALSASITQTNKKSLFLLHGEYSTNLTVSLVEQLNAETGLDFSGADATRFGDLELLVFPTLNDLEQNLLSVKWTDSPRAFCTRFDPVQVPFFDKFQFRLSIANDGQIVSSAIALANRDEEGVFTYVFQVSEELRERTDSTELEVFGFSNDSPLEGVLCCRWRVGYVREITFQGHVVGTGSSPVKFDWLEKATRPVMTDRVKAALTVNRGNLGFGNRVGGRKADPWVSANRELSSLFARLNPPKSEGRFFQRWSMGDGEGRLQFVEWFRSLLAKYQQHQIVIFDPYFETAGLGLVLICAATNSDYIVFTSLPKPSKGGEDAQDECENPISGRVNNLIASCEHNSHLLSRIKFCIYGLKEGRLHDRYVLVMGEDDLPVAGFHLSNSFQKAAENFPLLITPIPADVLLQVEQYKSALVREAKTTQFVSEAENPAMRLLFDSTASSSVPRRYEPLSFIEKPEAGSVLSVWSGENSLKGLSGDQLRTQMAALGLLRDNSLLLIDGLKNCVARQEISSKDFTSTWEVLGEAGIQIISATLMDEWREVANC